MSKTITISKADLAALIEKEVAKALKEPAKKGKKAKKAKQPKGLVEAKKHCRERREVRWNEGKAASSGMTAKQRRALAATLPEGYTQRQWNAACKKFKQEGGFR